MIKGRFFAFTLFCMLSTFKLGLDYGYNEGKNTEALVAEINKDYAVTTAIGFIVGIDDTRGVAPADYTTFPKVAPGKYLFQIYRTNQKTGENKSLVARVTDSGGVQVEGDLTGQEAFDVIVGAFRPDFAKATIDTPAKTENCGAVNGVWTCNTAEKP